MSLEAQDFIYKASKAKAALERIPFHFYDAYDCLCELKSAPEQFIRPLQWYLLLLGGYARDARLREISAFLGAKLQNINVQSYLQLCHNAHIRPEPITTVNANLAVLCENLSLKYPQSAVEIDHSGGGINSMGWDIDEIVYFVCGGKVRWKFCLLYTEGFEGQGFPCVLCNMVASDLLAQTVLADFVQDLGFDDSVLENVLQNVQRMLFLDDCRDLYKRYLGCYMSGDVVPRFIGAAWHCIGMIRQQIYADEYYCILQLLLAELNKQTQIPTSFSYQLQEVYVYIFEMHRPYISMLLLTHASLDWSLAKLKEMLSYDADVCQFSVVLRNICDDGRIHLLNSFFDALLGGEHFIFSTFYNCLYQVNTLCGKTNLVILCNKLLAPRFERLKRMAGVEFELVTKYKHFKHNRKAELHLSADPVTLLQELSVAAIYVLCFHTRPVNIVSWFGTELEEVKCQVFTGLSVCCAVCDTFLSQAKKKLEGALLKEIKVVCKTLTSACELHVARYFGEDVKSKRRHLDVAKQEISFQNRYFALFHELAGKEVSKDEICLLAAHSSCLNKPDRALRVLRHLHGSGFDVAAAIVLLAYRTGSHDIAAFYKKFLPAAEPEGDFLQFRDFYCARMAKELRSAFVAGEGILSQAERLISDPMKDPAQWVDSLAAALKQLDPKRGEQALLILRIFEAAGALPAHLRMPARLASFDCLCKCQSKFAYQIAQQMCEQMTRDERDAFRSVTGHRDEAFQSRLSALMNGLE